MKIRPAIFDGKMLKKVSSCIVHPKYQALRIPTSTDPNCTCMEIWDTKTLLVENGYNLEKEWAVE